MSSEQIDRNATPELVTFFRGEKKYLLCSPLASAGVDTDWIATGTVGLAWPIVGRTTCMGVMAPDGIIYLVGNNFLKRV